MSDESTPTNTSSTPLTVWQRSPDAKSSDRAVLIGARLRSEWLKQEISLLAVRFTGPLQTALQSLLEASKGKDDKNLPIVKLRALFMAKLEGIVRLDRDLALKDAAKAALELRAVGDDLFDEARHAELKEEIADTLLRWHMDIVAPWAERNALVEPASAVKREISAAHIDMQPRRQPLLVRQGNGQVAKPQWDLIAKHLAERLTGEELFEGLGPCELIADATSLEGSVELMTWPTKVTGSDTTFSMVARLSVASWPTGGELYLKITPVKRVWAKKVPGRKPNAPPTVRCYVFSPERPVLPANIRRTKEGWEFGDEYALYQSLTTERNALPVTLKDAIQRPRPTSGSWWVGLPELTTLFDYVQQRTVFESDEVDLRDRVVELLPDVLDPLVPYRVVKIPRAMTQAKSEVARLKVGDVAPDGGDIGVAGAALEQPEPSDDEESSITTDEEAAVDNGATEVKRRARLERHRNTNSSALQRIHSNHTPSLWVFVDGADEKKLIEGGVRAVFGESLRLEFSPLPQGVHGLRSDLELSDEKGVRRFEARVDRWKPVAEQVKEGATGARHVLICAAKDVDNRAEDPVNYFAGLHAMCMHGEANVHHLLPLEKDRRTGQLDLQHFIHRVQSALLDVFLAHSGVVFGVQSFVRGCLGENSPKAIYGVQAIRSNARAFTQEQRVCLIVFTRLDVATGATSVAFAGRRGNRFTQMDWKPLNEGLQWLGSQRQLSGDERWLKESFGDIARKMLGKICEEDPKAVVLVDWSTVAGLWRELSDESLIAAQGRGPVLDGTDFGKAYPHMTLLRLRADRNATMVMRWVNTKKFDEWRSEPAPTPTRTSVEEQYATTYKTAVALDEAAAGSGLKHYLVVMGYRNTVQTKRGMSCFRPRSRMSPKGNGWFERRTLPVAKDNAALPGGLEVTVLHTSDALKPDSLVSLVMGLRLGYAHYDDWTALPAPLFFERKVRDYIIRYADSAEADAVGVAALDSDQQALDAAPGLVEAAASLQSELVAEVLEGLPELMGDAAVAIDAASPGGSEFMATGAASNEERAPQEAREPFATRTMNEEEKPVKLDDPRLQRALEAGQAAPVLFSPTSGLAAKQTYEAMLAESVRVRVEPPWFVTKETVLPPDAWPKDKRAIGYYWKKLGTFPIRLRPQKGDAPSVAQFPDWVMRRLNIPQSAYALEISGLLPVSKRLFYKLDDCYGQYLDEAGKKGGGVNGGQFWKDLPDLVRHLSKEKNDEGLAWVFCMMGHHPYKDLLPNVLKAVDPNAMGPYALAGLQYMTACFETCNQVYDDRRNGTWKNKSYVVPGILRPADLVEPASAPSATNASSAEMPASAEASTGLAAAAESAVGGAESAPNTVLPAAAKAIARVENLGQSPPDWPVPGSDDFDTFLAACGAHLEDLKTRHEHHEAARRAAEAAEQARRFAEAQESAAAEAEAAKAALRAQWQCRLVALETLAREALAAIGPELEVGGWHILEAEQVVGSEPNDEAYQTVEQQVGEVQQAVAQANSAALAVIKIDAGEFEDAETLPARDKLRRKTALLSGALERSGEAEQNLKTSLTACALLAEGLGTSPADPTPDQLPETESDPVRDLHTVASEIAPDVVEQAGAVAAETKEDSDHAGAKPAHIPIAQRADVDAVNEEETEPPRPEFEDWLPPEDYEVIQLQASGPQPLTEPALKTLAECLHGRYWALASAEAVVLNDVLPGAKSKLWAAVPAILRSAEQRVPLDASAVELLGDWLVEVNAAGSRAHSFPEHLGVLGAALLPMLLQGSTDSVRWAAIEYLRPRLQQHAELHAIIERIATLDSIQLDLTPDILSAAKVSLQQALQDGVMRMRRRAKNWVSDSDLVTTWAATDYIEMHAAICSGKSGFATGLCIEAIARGDDAKVRAMLPEVQKLAGKGLSTIGDLRRKIGRRRPIEGVGRDYLVQNLRTTADFAAEYVALLDKQRSSKQASLPPKHADFLSGLFRELKAALGYVAGLDLTEDTSAVHKQVLVSSLTAAIDLMDQEARGDTVAEEEQVLLLRYPLGRDLKPVLTWSPSSDEANQITLGEAGQLHSTVMQALASLRRGVTAEGKTTGLQRLLSEAAEEHRVAQRLLPARLIAERLDRQGRPMTSTWHDATDTIYRAARNAFKLEVQDAQQRVTNALALSALSQTEAGRMLKVLESLSRANNALEIGASSKGATLYPDFPHARAVLQDVVLKPLDSRIDLSRQKLRLEIEDFVREHHALKLDPAAMRQLEQKKTRILTTLDQGTALSVRVARSEFMLLKEGKLPLVRFEDRRVGVAYEAFRQELRNITQGHRVLDGLSAILRGEKPVPGHAPGWLSAIGDSENASVVEFIDYWQAIFNPGSKEAVAEALRNFFMGAGIAQEPTITAPNEGMFFIEGKPFADLAASGFGVFIPPALGSLATHIQGYILPRHMTSTPERFGQRVAQLPTNTPTFLLCREGLSSQQRAQLGHKHQVLLLDDDLVAFLATHPAERLAKLLEVSVLSFHSNPYNDYNARPVPPEMFFGRTQELEDLRNVASSAVLYGGRRLGKSSLLNQILEESKTHLQQGPDGKLLGELAVYVSLLSGNDPAGFKDNYRLFAWKSIYRALVTAGFISNGSPDLKSDQTIREHIQDEISAGRCKSGALYLLIDEADDVMREDLLSNAPFLASLQALSDSTLGRARIRYVIAGLHNLTRMTTGGNTALGKAQPIALQPFSSGTDISNGVDLITEPMAALGFYFERGDEGLPLRIMAVCNFYPAFIQLYCRNLVNRLYNNRAGKELTTRITSADLDAVECDEAFLQEIRDKFGLNLNLDKRYKAIALILAEHSYAEPANSVFAGLTATEIRDSCMSQAPAHFKSTAPGAYEALLDEMDKLTILERNGPRYQLRTPDIATMLGEMEQVSHLLEELARETPTEDRSYGEARLPVTLKSESKTFPMPSGWVRNYLGSTPGDLVVLVGNQLSGVCALEKLRGVWAVPQEDAVLEVRSASTTDEARNYVNGVRRKAADRKTRLIGVPSRSWQPDQMDLYAALAQDQGRLAMQGEAAGRLNLPTVRPFLIASPGQALALAMRSVSATKPLPKNAVVAAVPNWSDDAVYFRFNQIQHENLPVRDSAEARTAILRASCGYGEELESMAGSTLTVTEALALPGQALKRLAPDLQMFYTRIGISSCLPPEELQALETVLLSMHDTAHDSGQEHELLPAHKLQAHHLLFAQWMGLIQVAPTGVWDVPALYLDLLLARP
ncbi:MAG TPA: DUF3893 domain-containing protein [Candidatus Aquabacterium excrementipullorum]|nr:DUF3893 domain-containing protein [Candidatus Aquabacterium excrementipullorum]